MSSIFGYVTKAIVKAMGNAEVRAKAATAIKQIAAKAGSPESLKVAKMIVKESLRR
jgi:endonuclease V-like protein UPF0215 family